MQSAFDFVEHMSFVRALSLVPLAVLLHICEEWPAFPRWARRFASAKYSDREYIVTHALAVVVAAGAGVLVVAFPTRLIFHTVEVGHNVFKRW